MENNLLNLVKSKANEWLGAGFDDITQKEVKSLLENNETELIDSFYRQLEFGTGGLRGIMGVGTNRMNIYTVGMATQGLCNYVMSYFKNTKQLSAAIAYDSRNNSRLFAETTASIFAANGFKVYLFESLRPTPELSFAVRHFGCQTGVVITASHNPKEYNGYKAYWDDGGQVIAPHDENIIKEVEKISGIKDVKWKGNESAIQIIGAEIDEIYLNKIKELSLSPELIAKHHDMKIVYTPIHGTGVTLIPQVLKKFGFSHIINVPEQDISDGNFPTVKSPNPEESAALSMAIEKAKSTGADLVMASDPDADRVGIAVKNNAGDFILLNGNQTAAVLVYYLLSKWKENGKLKGKEYIVKTIVTTELLAAIANKFGVQYFDVLTGFKFIADIIKKNEGKLQYIGGGEESYGYLAGEFVRDKDAVMACALIAEAAVWAKEKGKSVYDLLLDIYIEFGLYRETLVNVVKKGKSGAEEIQKMMDDYRVNPPKVLGGSEVILIQDYQLQMAKDLKSGKESSIQLPKSNVLQFTTAEGTKITVRPSGTEPKIKFYFGLIGKLNNRNDYSVVEKELLAKIDVIKNELGL